MTPAARLRVVLYIVLGLQCAKMGRLVPIDTLFDGDPLTPYSFSQLYADVSDDRRLSAASGGARGFDPLVAAGAPVGVGFIEESHAVILFDRLCRPWLDPSATIKIFLWLSFLAAPLLLFAAGRLFGFSEGAIGIALLLSAAGTLGFDSFSKALVLRGSVGVWLAGHVALFNAACFFATLQRPSRWTGPVFALTLPLLLTLDPAVTLAQIAPLTMLAWRAPPRGGGSRAPGLRSAPFWPSP